MAPIEGAAAFNVKSGINTVKTEFVIRRLSGGSGFQHKGDALGNANRGGKMRGMVGNPWRYRTQGEGADGRGTSNQSNNLQLLFLKKDQKHPQIPDGSDEKEKR